MALPIVETADLSSTTTTVRPLAAFMSDESLSTATTTTTSSPSYFYNDNLNASIHDESGITPFYKPQTADILNVTGGTMVVGSSRPPPTAAYTTNTFVAGRDAVDRGLDVVGVAGDNETYYVNTDDGWTTSTTTLSYNDTTGGVERRYDAFYLFTNGTCVACFLLELII